MQRVDSICEGEDLDFDGELLVVGEHGAELVRALFNQRNDLLLVDKVDRDGEDLRLESAWQQRSQVVFELLVGLLLGFTVNRH